MVAYRPYSIRNEDSRALNLIVDDGWVSPWLDSNHVRLVLFHDHEGRGKIPVFDTKQYYQNSPKQVLHWHATMKPILLLLFLFVLLLG